MAKLTDAEHNLAAEARAVEAGHHALVMPGGWVKVVSDSFAGKWYELLFTAHTDGLLAFVCRPQGRAAFREDHLYAVSGRPGRLPCMHAALAARRLEREGLARLDEHGRWAASPRVLEEARARAAANQPADPWEGIEGETRG